MKYKLPIIIPTGLKPIITQPYGATGDLAFYKESGINMPFHNGCDITTNGTDRQTYGCPIITPTEGWVIYRIYWTAPITANGNEVVIHSSPFMENGINKYIELRFVHLSGYNKALEEGMTVPAGTILGYLGNSGLVTPPPTPYAPYAGTHLHLGMIEYSQAPDGSWVNPNEKNGIYGLLDPLTRIDINTFDTGPEDITKDAPALTWGIDQLKLMSVVDKIKYVWSILFK